ncbi:hypothetical protein MHC_02180 [Mycoplasma haemocanis str. Illinois]|uniref:Uncharacterized protein n=1 Tax=Mycoplasma haemocanis (strain Illinois) TaxID=1111676 RepID=H6N6N0_MYCHN|nr:hypothetical protein [Mycoplasma haemocanis]AEW45302.1 hypothetical protein MHC_02180 [Mycoplasma haemocanis str. Illinois]
MATLAAKFLGTSGVLGASGLGGYGIYKFFFHKISIKEAILYFDSKDDTYSFLSEHSSSWNAIKTEYAKESSKDKPMKGGVAVSQDDLPKWCSTAVKDDFVGREDAKYQSVIRWCYLNTNNFLQQVESKGRELIKDASSGSENPSSSWKSSWKDKYKDKRNDPSWRITDVDSPDTLNGEDESGGATALKNWCEKKKNVFMYAEEARSDFKKFFKFCTAAKTTH